MKINHIITAAFTILLSLNVLGVMIYKKIGSVPEIFRLNETLKTEGYYMAEFEFKMLGCAYYLDHSQYIKGFSCLNQVHKELKTREGLIKVPEFSNKKEKLEFFRNLQNPDTGAFMDDSYPLFTYIGVTANMLCLIEELSQEADESLHLKYPFKFLDEINTPQKLKIFLDDLSTAGWIGSKFRTPYVEAAELIELFEDMERNALYGFSPEWKQAILEWFNDNQDSKTGFWGARKRNNGELLDSGDLNSTEKIVKLFVDDRGNNLYPEFPLRYKDKMLATAIQKISQPMPEDLDERHEWILIKDRGIRLLTRYLWNEASPENKEAARKLMEDFIRIRFEMYYVEGEGGFSLYPEAKHSDLDGTGEVIGTFKNIGALSSEKQKLLWGSPDKNIIDLGVYDVSELMESDFASIMNVSRVNSIRLYRADRNLDDYTFNIIGVFYPKETAVLDVTDLMPKVIQWVNTTPQKMGNWVSKEYMQNDLSGIKIQPVPISKGNAPLELANEVLRDDHALTVIGFDVLQIPCYKMMFRIK